MAQTYRSSNPSGVEKVDEEVVGAVSIQTYGCKLNQADSEALARGFAQAGYRLVDASEPADIRIINTCTVTHVADAKARRGLRSAHRENPSSRVIATGCYAQRAPQELAEIDGVDLVVGNSEKHRLVDMILADRARRPVSGAVGQDRPLLPAVEGFRRTRAMIKIQEGCNQVCAYCIVPKVRGRERSVPPEEMLGQVRERLREGYREVVLTGTQLGSYGFDLPDVTLRDLIELLLMETPVERLRVSSLQPQEITGELLDLWDDPRLCPHFHVPLQSGSDSVLKRMRRRYDTAKYAEAVDRIRSTVPGAAITADLIVGFPGEGDRHFLESLQFARDMEFAEMHVFPYSVRKGTSAAYMGPMVDQLTKGSRMTQMLSMASGQAADFRRRSIGATRPVLWERAHVRDGKTVYLGLTDNYLKVSTEQEGDLLNRITSARLVGEAGGTLLAEVM